MKNFGQPWALVLAPGDNDSDVDAPSAFAALLRGVLNRAAAFADRAHIWAVVTQQRRQRLEGPLWFVPASSFVVLPEHGSTTYGILMGLMRIAQRDLFWGWGVCGRTGFDKIAWSDFGRTQCVRRARARMARVNPTRFSLVSQ